MEAIILAGGFGTRLKSALPNLPKPLAPIHGKPFLSYLMRYWKSQGVNHFILSVGYLHEKVIETFKNTFEGIPISYAIEKSALGTGGALLHASNFLQKQDRPFLALNGDTFFEIPSEEFTLSGACTLALYSPEKNSRYDGVTLTKDGQILKFGDPSSSLINGGCYLLQKEALTPFKEGPLSLEKDLLPKLVKQGTCYGKLFQSRFIDIGIPKDYEYCQFFLSPIELEKSSIEDKKLHAQRK